MRTTATSHADALARFQDWARSQGFTIRAPVADGLVRRFDIVKRGRAKKGRGWYVLHAVADTLVGVVGDWASGGYLKWTATGPSNVDRAAVRAELARARAQAESAQKQRHLRVAAAADAQYRALAAAPDSHPYLVRKRISGAAVRHPARVDGDLLVVPVFGPDRTIWSLQTIAADGTKRFLPGGRTKGALTRTGQNLQEARHVVVTEGFATACSIAAAIPDACVLIAFSASNLPDVAAFARSQRPGTTIVVAADNDAATDGNPGVTWATRAAQAVAGTVVTPEAIDGRPTDWNDVHVTHGLDAVAAAFAPVLPPAPPAPPTPIIQSFRPVPSWRDELLHDDKGKLVKGWFSNARLLIENHPDIAGRLRLDELANTIECSRLPWRQSLPDERRGAPFDKLDVFRLREWFQLHGVNVSTDDAWLLAEQAAKLHSFHPIRDYLRGLAWDGTERLSHWLEDVCGVDRTPYHMAVGRAFLISAVARVMRPGCKVDQVLMLQGRQGAGKSRLVRALFGDDWMREGVDLFAKHSHMVLQMKGAWCVEIAEMAGMSERERNTVKALITVQSDTTILPYDKHTSTHQRQCVFIATTNDETPLTDDTGNRRWWPVRTDRVDVDMLTDLRDQLWAEATAAFDAGEAWHLTGDDATAEAERQQAARVAADPWEEVIASLSDIARRRTVTLHEVFSAMNIPVHQRGRREEMRLAACMRRLGWHRAPLRRLGGDRVRLWVNPAFPSGDLEA